ncbi:hydroxymethylbilane synthase [Methermicoccus shengliensis]|uniref:Probable porphobilinogen deaminase n=1 Tax=Methermicoccus shengliensis TaxID=660064 RepID=A0A832RYG3_9EURY|nr:hydroxymethylbilane synthase [Methermicoccus shengliensis]KUK04604.1 MAG: Porphobilinogen deaminase [Euryarchaeota archaeon 55_53]KUK29992.1 MAG: Porphobilinogen deaminase [Methanosarcinales archeaon 56_1174]MDI3488474.1 hydroxymethylbilane synthase [Methanosarcinales archaeon]MDN5294932.1 hydroxymethylbilane synthase [Methanosarcinales archaeon]HIH70124.1 hydroxymethylbilane synthase [Methermicoccus shengliensis]
MHLRIGTRGSALALAQTKKVMEQLMRLDAELELEQVVIKTTGDIVRDRALHAMKGVGVFVRELDEALLRGEIDLAVHSMKDIPTIRPEGLITAAVLERESPYDCLITRDGTPLSRLPPGAVIGTSSLRRVAQLRRAHPQLSVIPMRGNITTRLRKLEEGVCDGIMLAEAGLIRMGWSIEREVLPCEHFLPSCNQGVIACVCMQHSDAHELLTRIDHPITHTETELERRVMEVLGGGCLVPMGVLAQSQPEGIRLSAEVLSIDGREHTRREVLIPTTTEREHKLKMAEELAKEIAHAGGARLIELAKEGVEG